MKSIIQEASSIIKAIEKGWLAAGKPNEFSIRIYEEPKKNFIGMTIQSAKIGIFFEEKKVETPKPIKKIEPIQSKKASAPIVRPIPESKKPVSDLPESERVMWTDEMLEAAQVWLNEALKIINTSISYKTEVSEYQLTFNLEQQPAQDIQQAKHLVRNLSALLLQAMRHKFKRPMRGFKILIIFNQ